MDGPNVPHGPRGPMRMQQPSLPSPSARGPPTGPAYGERGPRHSNGRNTLYTINNVLSQTQSTAAPLQIASPVERPGEHPGRRSDHPSRRERSRSTEWRSNTGEERPRDQHDVGRRDRERGNDRERRDERSERRNRDDGRERHERGERKRMRDGGDQGQGHGDAKRSRHQGPM